MGCLGLFSGFLILFLLGRRKRIFRVGSRSLGLLLSRRPLLWGHMAWRLTGCGRGKAKHLLRRRGCGKLKHTSRKVWRPRKERVFVAKSVWIFLFFFFSVGFQVS